VPAPRPATGTARVAGGYPAVVISHVGPVSFCAFPAIALLAAESIHC